MHLVGEVSLQVVVAEVDTAPYWDAVVVATCEKEEAVDPPDSAAKSEVILVLVVAAVPHDSAVEEVVGVGVDRDQGVREDEGALHPAPVE